MLKEFLWIMQGILFIFFTEEVLRKNNAWNLIFDKFENGLDIFLNWRSRANVLKELKIIPDFFSKIGGLSLIFMILIFFFKINHPYIMAFFFSLFLFSLVTIFSFNWVFKHKDTLKEFKPIIYFYGFILIIIAINLYNNPIYPDSLLEILTKYHIPTPNKLEIFIRFIFISLGILLSYYLITWGIALVIPSSILLILFFTSKISIFIKNYISKKTMIGIMSILQLLIFYGFYISS